MEKRERRMRRARRVRARAALDNMYRLCVHRTPRHMYAQIISPDGRTVLASASTVQKTLRETLGATGNKEAAAAVGKLIAERAREAGVDRVTFDRSGFRYHGRVKELAEAARESGLQF